MCGNERDVASLALIWDCLTNISNSLNTTAIIWYDAKWEGSLFILKISLLRVGEIWFSRLENYSLRICWLNYRVPLESFAALQRPSAAPRSRTSWGGHRRRLASKSWPAKMWKKVEDFLVLGSFHWGPRGRGEVTCGMARGAAARGGAAPWEHRNRLFFVCFLGSRHMKRILLLHSCITRFGKCEALFLFNANE